MKFNKCCEHISVVYQPVLNMWGNQEPYVTSQRDGRFPQGRLYISKEVNHKESNDTEATSVTPGNDHGFSFAKINYLTFF
ncbi:neuronal regeneration-related protein [Lissotriton helveticus]